MSFKDHDVEVGMEIGTAVGKTVKVETAGPQTDRQGGSLVQLVAGLEVNGVKVLDGAPLDRTFDFAKGNEKGFVAQAQTSAPQPALTQKLERGFS